MLNYARRFLIFFYNLFAITSIKFEKKIFKTSKTALAKNLLLIPFIHFVLNPSIPRSFTDASHRNSQLSDDARCSCTEFYRLLFYYFMIQYRVAVCVIVYVQILNQKKMIKFFNNCVRFAQHYEWEINFKEFERRSIKKLLIASATLIACYVFQFASAFQHNWQGVGNFMLFEIYGFIIYLCSSFVGLFLELLSFLIEDFTRKLSKISNREVQRNHDRSFQQFIDVDQLLTEFKDAFGSLFSIITLVCFASITVKVFKLSFFN